jgi:DNA-binding transcriptional MerR regulator
MPGVRPVRALVYPAGHLDQRAQADDGLVEPQLAGPDRDPSLPLVAADEPPGQHPAEHPDERPLPARHAQGRLAELQRGEPDVVRPRREQRGAPVQHGHPVAVREQVERVQVAVADNVRSRPGRVIRQPAGRIYQVRSAEFAGEPRQRREQVRYRHRDVADLFQLTAHQVGIERVQPCHRGGQQVRDLAQQPRHGRRGQPVKAGQRRPARRPVHDHEGQAEAVVRAAGRAHGRSREARGGHRALHDRLLASRARIRHQPGDQLGRPAGWRIRQREGEELGPEPALHRLGPSLVLQPRSAGGAPQHPDQPSCYVSVNRHGIYRNSVLWYCLDMTSAAETDEPLTIDDLARRVQLPVRTIREYHTMRLLPPPERRGRLGLYGDRHIQRLRLIIRLQRRGYSLAGIRDLLAAWESGTDLVTVLGVDESQAALDETPLWLTRAELIQRLPALDEATLARAGRIGLVRPRGEDHFGVRSPALLGLVADWVRVGVPLDEALDLIEVLVGDLDTLAGKLADLIVARIWEPIAAAGRAGELPDRLRRGRPMLLQGAASTLADRLGGALAERAGTARDGDRLRAALDEVRVGAFADAEGRIHRQGDDR